MKKKRVVLLIILILVAIIISVASVFTVINWNKIHTAYYVLTGKGAELEQKYEKDEEKLQESAKDLGIETIRPLTEEESNKLNSGEISKEEAIDLILGKNEETKPPDNNGTENDNSNSSEKKENANNKDENNSISSEYKEKNEEISWLIGELYVLKTQFSADLTRIEDWVNEQYRALCKEYGSSENIPTSVKTKVGKRAYEKALALEDECDVKVNDILSKVKVLLKETKQSTVIVDEIKASYENEKSKAISYYMSQF